MSRALGEMRMRTAIAENAPWEMSYAGTSWEISTITIPGMPNKTALNFSYIGILKSKSRKGGDDTSHSALF